MPPKDTLKSLENWYDVPSVIVSGYVIPPNKKERLIKDSSVPMGLRLLKTPFLGDYREQLFKDVKLRAEQIWINKVKHYQIWINDVDFFLEDEKWFLSTCPEFLSYSEKLVSWLIGQTKADGKLKEEFKGKRYIPLDNIGNAPWWKEGCPRTKGCPPRFQLKLEDKATFKFSLKGIPRNPKLLEK
jgi:hypothetical protein